MWKTGIKMWRRKWELWHGLCFVRITAQTMFLETIPNRYSSPTFGWGSKAHITMETARSMSRVLISNTLCNRWMAQCFTHTKHRERSYILGDKMDAKIQSKHFLENHAYTDRLINLFCVPFFFSVFYNS